MAGSGSDRRAQGERRRWIVGGGLGTLLLAILALRLAAVERFHSGSPDAQQYYRLSQSLLREGRYAFGPPPAPLSYARLPGYPLFLAQVAVRAPVEVDEHVARATRWNVALDLGTAAASAVLLAGLGLGGRVAILTALLVLCAPLHLLFAAYALGESLATFLSVLTLALTVLAARCARPGLQLGLCAGAGLALGLALLVRADAITLGPAMGLALLWGRPVSSGRRLAQLSILAVAAAATFSPWVLRNVRHFSSPHPYAAEWPAQWTGEPLPTGAVAWMRTWAVGGPTDGELAGVFAFDHRSFAPADLVRPQMVDDPQERARLEALLHRYNREGLSLAVDTGFRELAAVRRGAHPLRFWLTLPLQRLSRLYRSPRPEDFPCPLFGLTKQGFRDLSDTYNGLIYVSAGLGLLGLLLARRGRSAAILLTAIAARSLLHAWAVPMFVSQRYLIEAYPLLLSLAALGLSGAARAIGARQPRRLYSAAS